MSRLLFAAARGARVQAMDNNLGAILSSHAPLELSNDKRQYRIHPGDAHLQYGPISTALREIALTGDVETCTTPYLTIGVDREVGYWDSNNDQRCVFLLILAEALADEGL